MPSADVDEETVLVVAVCAGPRCHALRRMHDPTEEHAGAPGQLLRDAVRHRPGAVLISTPCLGPCHRGCVAAVGPGRTGPGSTIEWTRRPVGLGMIELRERAAELAEWIGGSAPDLAGLPADLWRTGAA